MTVPFRLSVVFLSILVLSEPTSASVLDFEIGRVEGCAGFRH